MVRVLIIDDSAFMRNALSTMLSSDSEITVVGTGRDGLEGVELAERLSPDLITLDIEMPKMDGIAALRQIMKKRPVPVIMISSLTTEGAKLTIEALEAGAVDFIPKNLSDPSQNILTLKDTLISKIKAFAVGGTGLRPHAASAERRHAGELSGAERKAPVEVVAIGTSTGGPRALQTVIPMLPKTLPVPVLISQHMPEGFTKAFADRLAQLSVISVKEAENGETLRSGMVYIAPGWGHMTVSNAPGGERVLRITEEGDRVYRPSVDMLFSSVADCYMKGGLGIVMTGMGTDGLKGAAKLKRLGGRVFAQDESTSSVFGMPRSVIEAGLAETTLALNDISDAIVRAAGLK